MQKRFLYVVVVAIALAIAGNAYAGIHWLPDFLGKNMDRTTDADDGGRSTDNRQEGCPNGWITAAEIGDKACVLKGTYPWVGRCYGDCICDVDKYPYTEENCKNNYGELYLAGEKCVGDKDYYTECRDRCDEVTDMKNYPDYGCKEVYDQCHSKCEVPYTDNCHNTEHKDNGFGCKPDGYYEDCPSECEVPYEDNCHIRPDNRTNCGGDGCDKWWSDCESKCEVGTTCKYDECLDYEREICPLNADCNENSECGLEPNYTTRYHFISCSEGYYDADSFFCDSADGSVLCTWSLSVQ